MVSKPKMKTEPDRGKPKVENKKKRNPNRGGDAELFKAVIEHSHDAIIFLDSERKIFYASPSIIQIVGYEPEELIGKPGIEFTHPDDREATTRQFLDLLQNPGKSIPIEYRLKHKNGSWHWVNTTATNFLDHPQVQAVVLNMRDITERVRAETRQTMLYETLHAVSGYLDADAIARAAVDTIGRLSGWASVAISLPSADKETWQTRAGYGVLVGEYGEQRPMSKGVIGRTYRTGETQNVPDVNRDPDYFRGEHPVTRSQLAVPIKGREQILGVINIESEHLNAFTSADVLLVESFADTVSLALDNARLYTAAQQEIAERKQIEIKLHASEDILRSTIESPKEINIVSINRDYEYLSFNTFHKDSMKQAYGIDVINGMNLLDCILADEERMKVKGFFDRALAGESHTSVEQYGTLNIYFWETQYSPIVNDENKIVGATAFSLNITERRQAEDNHRKAEAKYRMLVEQIPPIIYLAQPGQDLGVTYISPQIKTLGFTEEEWVADPGLWLRQIHSDDRAKVREYIERIGQSGEPYKLEYRLTTRAGVVRWFMDEVKDIADETGNTLFRQGFMLDITERKQSEEALSISKAQLLANLEHTPNVAVQWYDKDGRILYWNPASESMYGWKSSEALGKTLEQLIHTPEEQAEFIRILAEIQVTGKPYGPYEAQIRRKDGTRGWVLATTFSMPMPDGQLGFVCMDVDINERKQAEELIQRQLRRLNALHTIDMAINSSANIQITLEVLLGQTLSQLSIDAADVLLFNQPAQTLELTASRGFRSNISLQSQQRLGDGFAGQVINARRTIQISDLHETGKNLRQISMLANDSFTEYFGVPLIAKGQIKGVLEIYHRSPLNPEDDWLNFLEVLAGQAAIAIDNAQLVQGLQRSNMEIVIAYDATIEGWSRAMDLRDKETEGHTQRVTALTLKLARAMGIREADIIQIQRGGLLHDIGKLGVPDNILLKPGPLTDEEWAIMRQHPVYAFNMIAPVNYLKPALDIPYCHHEKWDGTGYPRGLQGEQIPLAARIFAVVDVWDALTSDRPYRPAWTKERTYEYILSLSGTHFDPKVVNAFFELRDRGWK